MYPSQEGDGFRAWVGVGGSHQSVIRAARYRLPLVLAIIGGDPLRFRPFVDLYHRAAEEMEVGPLPVAVHSPGHVADTDEQALEELYPHWKAMRDRIGGERGWGPASPDEFRQQAGPHGALCVGSPRTVASKIASTAKGLGIARFTMKYSAGTLPHPLMMGSIERFATQVAPLVGELLAEG